MSFRSYHWTCTCGTVHHVGSPSTFWLGTRRRWVTATAVKWKCLCMQHYRLIPTNHFHPWRICLLGTRRKMAIWALHSRCQGYELPGGRESNLYASVHVLLTVVAGAWWTSAIGVEITMNINECWNFSSYSPVSESSVSIPSRIIPYHDRGSIPRTSA